ncbi:glycosyltransferase family 4 protein [Bacillus aquiflavi]|uniref:Glycosyltransferase family 4 protein n=1 Tax=Bacillus aquiflavi TaxID=2672567 RepID=A0A6B3W356_9BACI|nr:glycosyltransferase family 4 protein [Bacillus aquiflavi]MBA4538047.1 glycosyltransferase family 4 protein [Bacillus aquiflavi]NEY82346.1 glycosyltransferase family 4 protein [Bacillus aquiflavi]UAC47872.1 glycosyltransferase family 4 protein [Bacillus aquiflavi]
MNILLINHYAGSNIHGMEYRPYHLAKEWVSLGHNVTIIAASHSHIRTKQPEVMDKWTEEFLDGIKYIWIKTPEYEGNGIKRILNMLSFIKELSFNIKHIVDQIEPSIVIASSTYPLDIYPASRIAKKANAQFIFEVHDLWPLSPMLLGNMSRFHPFIMTMQKAENDAYRKAHKVVSLLPKADQHMIEHGMASHKFTYLPNGIAVDQWLEANENIPPGHQTIIDELKLEGKFLIGYAGTHGIANALEYLFDACEALKDDPVAFVLVGKGPDREKLIETAKQKKLNNIYFLPVINKKAIPDFLSKMDCLYIGWRKSPLYQFGVSPNKLLDYMMSGKPIIHGIEAGNDLVAEAQCGISIPPEDPEQIAFAVRKMMNTPEQTRKAMGSSGKNFVMSKHDYKVLAKDFLKIMK